MTMTTTPAIHGYQLSDGSLGLSEQYCEYSVWRMRRFAQLESSNAHSSLEAEHSPRMRPAAKRSSIHACEVQCIGTIAPRVIRIWTDAVCVDVRAVLGG
eukprot:scaffold132992_cov78-Phaeocystis_antarctica.AAC.4